jgi:hypothetical protein
MSIYKSWEFPNVKIIPCTGSSQIGDRRNAAVCVLLCILSLVCDVMSFIKAFRNGSTSLPNSWSHTSTSPSLFICFLIPYFRLVAEIISSGVIS